MADARTAILITLDADHEGGFQDNPNDRANWTSGIVGRGTLVGTNGGITALDMPDADIKNLTIEQKIAYYLANYWKPFYSQIADQSIANKLFDLGVLFGIGTAVKKLQLVLDLVADGNFGPVTLARLNASNKVLTMQAFEASMTAHATWAAETNPYEEKALPGWIRRINS